MAPIPGIPTLQERFAQASPQSRERPKTSGAPQTAPAENAPNKQNAPIETFRDQGTGERTGFTLGGNDFFGPPSLVNEAIQRELQRRQEPGFQNAALPGSQGPGVVDLTQVPAATQQVRNLFGLAGQVGELNQGPFTQLPPQGTAPDYNQAIGAALTSTLAGAAGGAVVGAAVGGLGAIPGAVIGGLGGFLSSTRSELKRQRAESIQANSVTLQETSQQLAALITDTNQNPQNAAENLALFNQQMNKVDRAYKQLRIDTNSDLNKFLGETGLPELREYELFNSGERLILEQQMQTALLNPNPNKNLVTMEQLQEGGFLNAK